MTNRIIKNSDDFIYLFYKAKLGEDLTGKLNKTVKIKRKEKLFFNVRFERTILMIHRGQLQTVLYGILCIRYLDIHPSIIY